jgi:shikimate dehydrogenase
MMTTALIGSPVDHSVSPTLFKLYADEHGLEYAHSKFDVKAESLETVIKSLNAYGFAGVNITLPYKTDVIPFLDTLSPEAQAIGAVNTIKVNNGKLEWFNTDAFGSLRAIEKAADREVSSFDKAVVFGTGGAARAVVWVLLQKGAQVTVVFRNPESHRTETIKKDFANKADFINYDSLTIEQLSEYTIICNTTSAGMHPLDDDTPIEFNNFESINLSGVIVFDAVFNPVITKLQKWAESKGATLAFGIDMMIFKVLLHLNIGQEKK